MAAFFPLLRFNEYNWMVTFVGLVVAGQYDHAKCQIASGFEAIFGQADVEPNNDEQHLIKQNIRQLKSRIATEQQEQFTQRELLHALRKSNIKSSKGPDGVSNKLLEHAKAINYFNFY